MTHTGWTEIAAAADGLVNITIQQCERAPYAEHGPQLHPSPCMSHYSVTVCL